MAKSTHLNKEYFCQVCKSFFIATEDLLDDVHLSHECGEELWVTTLQCFNCESMLIPEGMNQIAWLREDMEDEERSR